MDSFDDFLIGPQCDEYYEDDWDFINETVRSETATVVSISEEVCNESN